MIYYHITEKSNNRKTGPILTLTSSRNTCSNNCPFKQNGCYANGWPLRFHWDKVSNKALTFDQLINKLPIMAIKSKKRGCSIIRLWQAGDMPGVNNLINVAQVRKLVSALQCFDISFGYTHKPMTDKNKSIIKYCNENNVIINLSANNLTHADFLFDLNIGPVSVVLPNVFTKDVKTHHGRKVVICPAVIGSITCSKCGGSKGPLCWRVDRDYIIGFPAHGVSAKKVSDICKESRRTYGTT